MTSYIRPLRALLLLAAALTFSSCAPRITLSPQGQVAWQRYSRVSPFATRPYSPENMVRSRSAVRSIPTAGVDQPIAEHIRYVERGIEDAEQSMGRAKIAFNRAGRRDPNMRRLSGYVGREVASGGDSEATFDRAFGNLFGQLVYEAAKDSQARAAAQAELRPLAGRLLGLVNSEIHLYKALGQGVPDLIEKNRDQMEDYVNGVQRTAPVQTYVRPPVRVHFGGPRYYRSRRW